MGRKSQIAKTIKKKGLMGDSMSDLVSTIFTKNSKFNNFNEMAEKYLKYRKYIIDFKNALTEISKKIKEYEPGVTAINTLYVKLFLEFFSIDEVALNNMVTPEEQDVFNNNYDNLKSSNVFRSIIRISSNIKKCGIKNKWLELEPRIKEGVIKLDIFNNVLENIEAPWDLCQYYYASFRKTTEEKQELTTLLTTLLTTGKNIYELVKVPDIPVDELFDKILEVLKQYRHSIRGSDKLFNMIEKKSQLFKSKFMTYYKQTLETGNPLILFQEFLSDVIKDDDIKDISLIGQCQSLLKEIRKSAAQMPKRLHTENKSMSNVIDKVMSFIDEFSHMDQSEAVDPDYLQKMVDEFQSTFTNLSNCTETELPTEEKL